MVIKPDKYPLLMESFELADQQGVLLYDIMTERFEISTILQRELSRFPEVFGELEQGTRDNPAISKESVHHFFKNVAGKPLKRPAWFFDIEQEGAGIVDVSTHLVDLIFWECYPEQPIDQNEVALLQARRWATTLTSEEFEKVTGMKQYPDYLNKYLTEDSLLNVYSNGEFVFTTKGTYGKVSVIWNFQAPEGANDTHYSIMRGSKANLVIRQDHQQQYIASLYVEPTERVDKKIYQESLEEAIKAIGKNYPGLTIKPTSAGWEIIIPDQYRVGHEAHFKQVTEKYLQYLQDGKLPEWELQNMKTKYYVTTKAYSESL
jgi:predicted dehydrogenase